MHPLVLGMEPLRRGGDEHTCGLLLWVEGQVCNMLICAACMCKMLQIKCQILMKVMTSMVHPVSWSSTHFKCQKEAKKRDKCCIYICNVTQITLPLGVAATAHNTCQTVSTSGHLYAQSSYHLGNAVHTVRTQCEVLDVGKYSDPTFVPF